MKKLLSLKLAHARLLLEAAAVQVQIAERELSLNGGVQPQRVICLEEPHVPTGTFELETGPDEEVPEPKLVPRELLVDESTPVIQEDSVVLKWEDAEPLLGRGSATSWEAAEDRILLEAYNEGLSLKETVAKRLKTRPLPSATRRMAWFRRIVGLPPAVLGRRPAGFKPTKIYIEGINLDKPTKVVAPPPETTPVPSAETQDADELLLIGFAEGESATELCDMLQTSWKDLEGRLRKLTNDSGRKPQLGAPELRLADAGMNVSEIASRLGKPHKEVAIDLCLFRMSGLLTTASSRCGTWTKEMDDALVQMVRKGQSPKTAGRTLGKDEACTIARLKILNAIQFGIKA